MHWMSTVGLCLLVLALSVHAQTDIQDGPYEFTRDDVPAGTREVGNALPYFNGSLGTLKRVEWTSRIWAAFDEFEGVLQDTQIWINPHPVDCQFVPNADESSPECRNTNPNANTTCGDDDIDDCRPLVICGTGANYRGWLFLPNDQIYGTQQINRLAGTSRLVSLEDRGYIMGRVQAAGQGGTCPPTEADLSPSCLTAMEQFGVPVADVTTSDGCSERIDTSTMRVLREAGCYPGRCVVFPNDQSQRNNFRFESAPAESRNVTITNASLLLNYVSPGPSGGAILRGERGLQIGFNDQEGSSSASNPTADPGPSGFDPEVNFAVTVTYFYDEFSSLVIRQRTTDNNTTPRFNFTTDFATFAGSGSLPGCSLTHPTECLREDLDAGAYTVTQATIPIDYELVSVECETLTNGAPLVTRRNAGDDFIDIQLLPSTRTVCTFINRPKEKVTIRKVQCPTGAVDAWLFDVTFTSEQTPACPFSPNGCTGLVTSPISDRIGYISTPNTPDSVTTVNITERAVPGIFTTVSCVNELNNDPIGAFTDSPNPTAELTLRQGSPDILCTFTNFPTVTIILNQMIRPDGDPANFTFSSSSIAGFNVTLGDNGVLETSAVPPCDDTEVVKVTQAQQPGYDLTAIFCTGGDTALDGFMGFYNLSSTTSGPIECTFINTRRAALKVTVLTMPPSDGVTPTLDFTGALTASLGHDGMQTVDNLLPLDNLVPGQGQYNVTAGGDPVGWELTSINCTDSNGFVTAQDSFASGRTAVFNLEPGELAECTFILTELSPTRVIYLKETVPAAQAQTFNFTFNSSSLSLSDGQRGMHTVVPGTYTVTEAATPGYALTGITCNDTDSTGNVPSGEATFVVGIEEVTQCVFTNTKLATVTIIKRLNIDIAEANFSFSVDGQARFLGQNESFSYLVPRVPDTSVVVVEDLTSLLNDESFAYELDRIECVGDSGTQVDIDPSNRSVGGSVNITLSAGDEVICTFYNNATFTNNPCPDSGVQTVPFTAKCCEVDTIQDMCDNNDDFAADVIPASYVLGSFQGQNLDGNALSAGGEIGANPDSVLQIGDAHCGQDVANHFTTGFFGFVAVAFKDSINGQLVAIVENLGRSSSGVMVRAMVRQADNTSSTNTFLDLGARLVDPTNNGLQKLVWDLPKERGVCIDTAILDIPAQDLADASRPHVGVHINTIYGTNGCECPTEPLCPPPKMECYNEFQKTWVMPPSGQMTLGQLGLKFRRCYTVEKPPRGTTF